MLHPRGSEYDVQYVVDGLPVTENRSSAFAPSLGTDQVDSIRVLTASYPAEYGRKLGGVIEVTTKKNMPAGMPLRLEVPFWGRFSSYLSYANQSGIGQGPINGGLFLGSEAVSGLTDVRRFAVSQDQHNTVRARVRFQATRRMWFSLGGQYGSGLPSDIGSTDPEFLLAQYGEEILHRVDLDRGRVRPSFSLDAAVGMEVYRKEQRSASFQIQMSNATDRVNVINFASLFFRYSRCPATKRFGALKADLLKVIAFAETVPETFDLERSKSSSVHRCGTAI